MHFVTDFTQKAVVEVYNTMLSLRVEVVSCHESPPLPAPVPSVIVGSVGYAGKINGAIYMYYSEKLACAVTEKLLGMTPSSSHDSEVGDVIGEIANMAAGDMKRRTSDMGYSGYLATPIIMRGEQVVVDPKDAPIDVYNVFRIPDLGETFAVRTFAKLEA